MSIHKEGLIALENIEREQVLIYNDALDVGVYATKNMHERIKFVLDQLLPLAGKDVHIRQTNKVRAITFTFHVDSTTAYTCCIKYHKFGNRASDDVAGYYEVQIHNYYSPR